MVSLLSESYLTCVGLPRCRAARRPSLPRFRPARDIPPPACAVARTSPGCWSDASPSGVLLSRGATKKTSGPAREAEGSDVPSEPAIPSPRGIPSESGNRERSSGSRIVLPGPAFPSSRRVLHARWDSDVCRAFRPRLQRRDRGGFAPPSLFPASYSIVEGTIARLGAVSSSNRRKKRNGARAGVRPRCFSAAHVPLGLTGRPGPIESRA